MVTIKEALGREVGENVIKISGLVTKAGKRTESDHPEYGHTSFQPITIKDETGEIGITLGNQLEIKQGVSITIEAHKSDKHGFTGIKVEEYKDKKQLKVSKSAIITVEGAGQVVTPQTPKEHVKQPIPAQKEASVSTYSILNDLNERKFIFEREKQILIIRQNCIGNAVNYIVKKDKLDFCVSDVIDVAGEFEKWILRDAIKEDAGFDVKKDDEEIPF